jgi:hypothetical protein
MEFRIIIPGTIIVGPPYVKKRWFGLRKQHVPETVQFFDWYTDGGDPGIFRQFLENWDECVAAAQESGTYFDYREGTDRYGKIPESLTVAVNKFQ